MFEWLIRMAAWATGFSPRQLQLIEASMPATRKLIDLVNTKILPLVKQAQPLITEAETEIQTIAPAIEAVLVVVERHMAAGKTQSQSLAAIEKYLSGLSGH